MRTTFIGALCCFIFGVYAFGSDVDANLLTNAISGSISAADLAGANPVSLYNGNPSCTLYIQSNPLFENTATNDSRYYTEFYISFSDSGHYLGYMAIFATKYAGHLPSKDWCYVDEGKSQLICRDPSNHIPAGSWTGTAHFTYDPTTLKITQRVDGNGKVLCQME